ncbi:flagellar export chaperone FlgN [Chitinispirillales bacterium ANBcel5]|uniref:flagellar export chaperone FlgN n=1 Tax=Cellulosispirillum alkaliphilum TaxID=3039283 RepID=UPI002A55F424|nr:flagellar export chaperone FlgN [Chitinispirillales bacterium ANBcel5]
MDLTPIFKQLTELLSQELELYTKLIKSATCINQSIKEDSIELLNDSSKAYDEQIWLVDKLEEKRIDICNTLCNKLNLPHSVRLSKLLQFAPTQFCSNLEKVSAELKESAKKLSEINTSNRILLEESLVIMNNSFDLIKQSTRCANGYKKRGKQNYSPTGVAVINQVI